jgi:hypothetical protein
VLKIELPEDVMQLLSKRWADLSRHIVETLAAEGYREGTLSHHQVQRMLGLDSRFAVDEFMKERRVPFPYGPEELQQDAETLRDLRPARSR